MVWPLLACLRDYCANCSLAGLSYIANHKLHLVERLFWLVCIILSAFGSYHLISEYEEDFQSRAVSIVYESISPRAPINFPTIAVCETLVGGDSIPALEDLLNSWPGDYDFDIETFILETIFPHLYHAGEVKSRCSSQEASESEVKCPHGNYREFVTQFTTNCSDYFVSCALGGRAYNCCQYFRPFLTPFGNCFLLNSIQNNRPGSAHWFPNLITESSSAAATMVLVSSKSMEVRIMNEEDVPYANLAGITVSVQPKGKHTIFQISVENMVNDPDVREVQSEYRRCRFPDEVLPHSVYRAYSFSACMVDCFRLLQLRICNCTLYNLLPQASKTMPDCDYEGYLCLEKHGKVEPDIKMFLPWPQNNESCNCLPSCTEHDLRAVSEYSVRKGSSDRTITISIAARPTEHYRRQALRTRLDVVVTIGGIMGLFMGASVLSLIELIYFFTLRLFNNIKMLKRQEQEEQRKRRKFKGKYELQHKN